VVNFPYREGSKKTSTIAADKDEKVIDGIWLFTGEGAFCKRKPLPHKMHKENNCFYSFNSKIYIQTSIFSPSRPVY
jgi:hypothetical protein